MDLQNQVAVVTGASSGIGEAVAKNLNEAGCRLVLTARRNDRLKSLCSQLREAVYLDGDITDPELPARLIEKAVDSFGACDIVFNNAGILETGEIDEIDIEKVCQMVRINVEAAFRMIYVALRHFKKTGKGHLINTSSIVGTKVRPTVGAYAGTKYAIEAISEALRMELAGTEIQVSCVEPGLVLTELHKDWEVHPMEKFDIPHPLQPEDIARSVRFILEQPAHVRIPRLMILPGEHAM